MGVCRSWQEPVTTCPLAATWPSVLNAPGQHAYWLCRPITYRHRKKDYSLTTKGLERRPGFRCWFIAGIGPCSVRRWSAVLLIGCPHWPVGKRGRAISAATHVLCSTTATVSPGSVDSVTTASLATLP